MALRPYPFSQHSFGKSQECPAEGTVMTEQGQSSWVCTVLVYFFSHAYVCVCVEVEGTLQESVLSYLMGPREPRLSEWW